MAERLYTMANKKIESNAYFYHSLSVTEGRKEEKIWDEETKTGRKHPWDQIKLFFPCH